MRGVGLVCSGLVDFQEFDGRFGRRGTAKKYFALQALVLSEWGLRRISNSRQFFQEGYLGACQANRAEERDLFGVPVSRRC
jgi:hypothetical protein